jgi:amino-acid N-acetyltransferase
VNIYRNPSAPQVGQLLAACDLPASDLSPEHMEHFFACGAPGAPQGIVGLEIHGEVALLRSLAVAAERRGMGYGSALVAAAESHARLRGVQPLYLLTTSAGRFFEHLGYAQVSRESAPEEIRRTREFSALCPSSAAFMLKALQAASSA